MPATAPLQKINVTPAMRQELQALFDQFIDKPFRRADLIARLRRRRIGAASQTSFERIADAILKDAARDGAIARHGHLHWIRLSKNPGRRQLRSGRLVPEQAQAVTLTVDTHVPTKYLLVDLETGDLWEGTARGGWTRASAEALEEIPRLALPANPRRASVAQDPPRRRARQAVHATTVARPA